MSTHAKNHRIRSNNPCTSLKAHTTMSTSINSLAECETTTVSTQAKNLRVQTILACFQSPHNDINVSPATAECRQGPQRCQRKRRTIGSNQTNLASFQKPQRTERPTTNNGKSSGTSTVSTQAKNHRIKSDIPGTHTKTTVSRTYTHWRNVRPQRCQRKRRTIGSDNPGTPNKVRTTVSTQAKNHRDNVGALVGWSENQWINACALLQGGQSHIGSMKTNSQLDSEEPSGHREHTVEDDEEPSGSRMKHCLERS